MIKRLLRITLLISAGLMLTAFVRSSTLPNPSSIGYAHLTVSNGSWYHKPSYTITYFTELDARPEFAQYTHFAAQELTGRTNLRVEATSDRNAADFIVSFEDFGGVAPAGKGAPGVPGTLKFNSNPTGWSEYPPAAAAEYWAAVALHEMGHVVGLTHASPKPADVMEDVLTYYEGGAPEEVRTRLYHLGQDTINLINHAYDSDNSGEPIPQDPPWTPPPPPPDSPTSNTATNPDSTTAPAGTKRIVYKWRKGKRRFRYKCRGCVRIVRR